MLTPNNFTVTDASHPRSMDYLLSCVATSATAPLNRLMRDAERVRECNIIEQRNREDEQGAAMACCDHDGLS